MLNQTLVELDLFEKENIGNTFKSKRNLQHIKKNLSNLLKLTKKMKSKIVKSIKVEKSGVIDQQLIDFLLYAKTDITEAYKKELQKILDNTYLNLSIKTLSTNLKSMANDINSEFKNKLEKENKCFELLKDIGISIKNKSLLKSYTNLAKNLLALERINKNMTEFNKNDATRLICTFINTNGLHEKNFVKSTNSKLNDLLHIDEYNKLANEKDKKEFTTMNIQSVCTKYFKK